MTSEVLFGKVLFILVLLTLASVLGLLMYLTWWESEATPGEAAPVYFVRGAVLFAALWAIWLAVGIMKGKL